MDALLQKRYDIGFYQSAESYLRSLRILKHTRDEAAAVKFMEREDSYNAQDCGHMWGLLTPQNKRKFIRAKIRSRDIHDYLVRLADRQQHENVRIKYKSMRDFPLTGKVDDLIFSLPPDTEQLANLGRAMHNCVGTYRDRVLSDKVRIIAAFKTESLSSVSRSEMVRWRRQNWSIISPPVKMPNSTAPCWRGRSQGN